MRLSYGDGWLDREQETPTYFPLGYLLSEYLTSLFTCNVVVHLPIESDSTIIQKELSNLKVVLETIS